MSGHKFAELVDLDELERLVGLFQKAVGVPVGVVDIDGTVLIEAGWQDICAKFHRVHPETAQRCQESNAYIRSHLHEEGYVAYQCKNGLWDIGVPVVVDGEHLASMFCGQLFFEDARPDTEFFRQQAQAFGFDEEEYLDALNCVPVYSREEIRDIMEYYAAFANFVGEMGLAHLQQERTEQSLRESQEQLKQATQEVIETQRQALKELSTPIIPVMDRIIVMPLVGSIDSMRARDLMRALLAGIRAQRAKVVILDITGVPIVDSGVAAHLDKTIQAARLKGARTIITGISDAVAEAIVDLGIDWRGVETLRDLQTGLLVALDSLGFELSEK